MTSEILAGAIRDETGLEPESLGSRALALAVRTRVQALGLPDAGAYTRVFSSSRAERMALIEELVVPETWFFRERAAFSLLAEHALSARGRDREGFQAACLACATGEEPYSAAITLFESGLTAFHIDGLDISNSALSRARNAVYGPRAEREAAVPPQYRIELGAGQFGLTPAVRSRVSFYAGNVTSPELPGGESGYDAIFCRNVLIYLTPRARQRCLLSLSRLLRDGGILFLGSAEDPRALAPGWLPTGPGEAFAYTREPAQPAVQVSERPFTSTNTSPQGRTFSSVHDASEVMPAPRPLVTEPVPCTQTPHGLAPRAGPPGCRMTKFVPPESCWRLIGTGGDRTCPELPRVVHCRNCEVLTRMAEAFLQRPAPAGYAEFFTGIVAEPPRPAVPEISVVLFRLGREWMALDTRLFGEIADMRPVHRIAHRVGTLVSGLVNIRGQLHLCVALDKLLEIPLADGPAPEDRRRERLAVIGTRAETWVFRVSEVHGVHRFSEASLESPPATLPPSLMAVTRGIFAWGDRRAAYLDASQLQLALRRVAG